jgi:hypothetical protein
MTSTNNRHTSKRLRILGRILVICGCFGPFVSAGCYDTDPVHVDADPSPVLSPDAGPCEMCGYAQIEGESPLCAAAQATCSKTNNCLKIMRCILQAGCFEGASFANSITCGTPCALAHGANGADDPQVQAGLVVAQCVVSSCANECR